MSAPNLWEIGQKPQETPLKNENHWAGKGEYKEKMPTLPGERVRLQIVHIYVFISSPIYS
jgi:hypothetical protein